MECEFGEYSSLFIYIGVFVTLTGIIYLIGKFVDALQTFVLSHIKKKDLRGFGKWAAITGGSSGIGKSYSYQFASLGYDILLISNEIEDLKNVSEDLKVQYDIKTQIVCVDFCKAKEAFEIIKTAIKDKEIGVLVNNVGIRGNQPCYFLEETAPCLSAMANINCLAALMMTHLIIPKMLERNKGIVLNLCSVGALLPIAMGSVYSASKAFTDNLTRALQIEYKGTGLIIQGISPFYVCTRMTRFSEDLSKPSFLVPDSDDYVRSAINTIGIKHFTSGYWPHSVMTGILYMLPVSFVQYLNFLQYDMLKWKNESAEKIETLKSKEYFNWLKNFLNYSENIENLDSKNL